jgi:TetR/AcrR family transcriptional regulator
MPTPLDASPAASTRDAILDGAERLFAVQGFAATTVKQIAAASGVNSALLYYYFADKETLYRQMLSRTVGGFAEAGTAAGAAGADPASDDPAETIRRFVRFQVEYMAAHPHVPRLLAREMGDHQAARAEEQIAHLAAGLFERLCTIVRDGQRTGLFRRDVDPRFAAISTVSQVVYALIARPAMGILLGHGRGGPPLEVLRVFAEHAGDFAVAALAIPGAPAGPVAAAPTPGTRRRR